MVLAVQRALAGARPLEEVRRLTVKVDAQEQPVSILGEMLPNLQHLNLSRSVLPSIRDLGTSLRRLRVLWLVRCGLADLDGISVLANLQELYLSFNGVRDLGPLALHDKLEVLDLEANCVSSVASLDSLSTCPRLTYLSMEANPLCVLSSYRRIVAQRVPQLESLDDVPIQASDRAPGLTDEEWDRIEEEADALEAEERPEDNVEDNDDGDEDEEEQQQEQQEEASATARRGSADEELIIAEMARGVRSSQDEEDAPPPSRETRIWSHLHRPPSASGLGDSATTPSSLVAPGAHRRRPQSARPRPSRPARPSSAMPSWRPSGSAPFALTSSLPPSSSSSSAMTTGRALAGNLAVALRASRRRAGAQAGDEAEVEGGSITATLDALLAQENQATTRRRVTRPQSARPTQGRRPERLLGEADRRRTLDGTREGSPHTATGEGEEDDEWSHLLADVLHEVRRGTQAKDLPDRPLLQLLRIRPKHIPGAFMFCSFDFMVLFVIDGLSHRQGTPPV